MGNEKDIGVEWIQSRLELARSIFKISFKKEFDPNKKLM
jgi:hypothetical protein